MSSLIPSPHTQKDTQELRLYNNKKSVYNTLSSTRRMEKEHDLETLYILGISMEITLTTVLWSI